MRIQPGMEPGTRLPVPGTNMVFQLAERRHARFERHGDNLHMPLSLSLYEALTGWRRPVRLLDERRVWVGDERGAAAPGAVRRLRGHGFPRYRQSGRGDLYLHLSIRFPEVAVSGEAASALRRALKGSAQTASPVAPAGERVLKLEAVAVRESR